MRSLYLQASQIKQTKQKDKNMSQEQQILKDLEKGKRITALDALKKYGCLRLAARILEIKNAGYNVDKSMVKKNGKTFASYYLR
jgi:ribosomal protein L9